MGTRRISADNALLIIAAIVALIFGILAFSPPTLEAGAKGDTVATLDGAENAVKRKSADGLAWDPALVGADLQNGDQIFTDKAATARVRFKDGTEIDVAENSLIRVEQRGGKTTIDMEKGFVAGRVGEGGGGAGVTIKMGDTKVQLSKDAEIQLAVDPNDKSKNRIALVKGEADVASASGEKLALAKDQVLSVSATGKAVVETLRLKGISPASEKIDGTGEGDLTFKWESSLDGIMHGVQLARDGGFNDVIARRDVKGKSLTLPIPAQGTYYWRVFAVDPSTGKTEQSLPLAFSVTRLTAPELVAPPNGKRFLDASGGGEPPQSVPLVWRAENGESFEVEVAKEASFRETYLRKATQEKSLDATGLVPGSYVWRVRSLSENGAKKSPWSAPLSFGIDRLDPPAPPELGAPVSAQRGEPGAPISFSWNAVKGANGYEVQIGRDKSFSDVLHTERPNSTSFAFTIDEPGTYFWKARSLDPASRPTSFGQPRSFVIDALVPQLVLPDDGAELTVTSKDFKIDFSWIGKGGATGFELEIAGDESFKDPVLRRRLPGPAFSWRDAKAGRYFWRVRASVSGVKGARFTTPRSVTIKELELLPPPSLRERYDFMLPPPVSKESAGRNLFKENFMGFMTYALAAILDLSLLPTAALAQEKGPRDVTIEWEEIEGATSYAVELATDKDFESVVLRRVAKEPRFEWAEAKLGRYFLRAASIDQFERRGRYSRTAFVTVNYRAPSLISPEDGATITTPTSELRFQPMKGARYTVEIASDDSFSTIIKSVATSAGEVVAPNLPDGDYHWRVKARYSEGLPTVVTAARRLEVKTRLDAPRLAQPEEGVELPGTPDADVTLVWEESLFAARYELEVDGELVTLESNTAKKHSETYAPGLHAWRVRGVAKNGARSPWSESQKFRVKAPLAAPSLLKPKNNEKFGPIAESQTIEMRWLPVKDATEYEWEIERDGSDEPKQAGRDAAAEVTVTLPPGTYKARVRALAEGMEPSPYGKVKKFVILKTEPEKNPEVASLGDAPLTKSADGPEHERLRLSAAFAPSIVTNSMVSTAITNKLSVAATNSFLIALEAWATENLSAELIYHRRKAELYENSKSLEGSTDQTPLEFAPQNLDARARYDFRLNALPLSPRITARGGYLYKTFYTYFAKSRTAIDLEPNAAHHASFGGGAEFYFAPLITIYGGLDYAIPLSSSPLTVTSGRHLTGEVTYWRPLGKSLRFAAGYRYGNASYAFKDEKHDLIGILDETTNTFVVGLGYGI